MKVSIRGGANLHVIDRETNEVKTVHSFNLITKYGLSRILAATDRGEKLATHICLGFKTDEPSAYEDTVPSNYFVAPCEEYINNSTYDLDRSRSDASWSIQLGEDLPVGFSFNHVYLANMDKDGVLHPLTSLKFKTLDDSQFTYTHTERDTVGVRYSITFVLNEVTGTSTSVTGAHIVGSTYTYDETEWYNRVLAGPGKNYESSSTIQNLDNYAYIKDHKGYFNDDGNWIQIYEIVLKPMSGSTNTTFRLGIAYINLTTARGRASETIELKFEVSDLPEVYEEPVAISSVVPAGTGNSRPIKFTGAPFQTFEVYSGQYLLLTQTLGKSGTVTTGSGTTTVFDMVTGTNVSAPEPYMLSSGGQLRIVTKTRKGTAETILIAPDLQADDVKAIWFINPTTIRAVANYNDEIKVSWEKEYLWNTSGNRVFAKNVGKCTTVFAEDDRFYYCDIDVSEFDPQIHKGIRYICTDAAGNVFDSYQNSNRKFLLNYVDGLTYKTANLNEYEYGLRSELGFGADDPENDYRFALKVLSGDIS